MGLDIYLYPIAAAEANRKHYAIWDEDADGNYAAGSMTDEQRRAHDEANPHVPHESVPSERYPDHLFNRRYLRSSYNSGGFNHAVPEMLASAEGNYPDERGSLYWIFEPLGRDWNAGGDEAPLTAEDIPRLRQCRDRANDIAEALRASDRLRVMTVSPNMFKALPSHTDDDALRIYRQHAAERQSKDDGWYSTMGGDLNVYGGGLSVIAAIPGQDTFKIPAVHLLYRASDDGFDSYVQSAEITVEFCDEAIMLVERDGSCEISWSG